MGRLPRHLASALCIVLAVPVALARAQFREPPPLEPSSSMATRLAWAEYRMNSGRVLGSTAIKTTHQVPHHVSQEGARIEKQVLTLDPDRTTNVEYELTSPAGYLALILLESNKLAIMRNAFDGQYRLIFNQAPKERVTFSLADQEIKSAWTADSFWHLYLAEPELVSKHLVPILELLHPGWQLAEKGAQIERALLQRAERQQPAERKRWTQLVDDLGSTNFTKRQNAERELAQIGPAIVPFLQNLDRKRLDAEQAYRVRIITDALAAGFEDTSDRLVTWLADDPQIWLAIAGRDDLKLRKLAARQLNSILEESVAFDPAGDAATRRTQLEKLSARLQRQ